VVGWLVVFAALAFLPDDQAVGADFLLVIVTIVWTRIASVVGVGRGPPHPWSTLLTPTRWRPRPRCNLRSRQAPHNRGPWEATGTS
jgi:hypothetical protein